MDHLYSPSQSPIVALLLIRPESVPGSDPMTDSWWRGSNRGSLKSSATFCSCHHWLRSDGTEATGWVPGELRN